MTLIDGFGRVHRDLRVSLTDRCNLRCTYCMPEHGQSWLASQHVLTDDEVVECVGIALQQGIRKVRFTGGEPLLRTGLEQILARVATMSPRPELALTTNGIGLERRADGLRAAGLDRVNVSLDTLRADRFARLSRRDRLEDVLSGIEAALRAGFDEVKVNTVLMRGVNDDEACEIARWCLARGVEARFIEQMPLDAQHGWARSEFVTVAEVRAALSEEFVLEPMGREHDPSAPAGRYRIEGSGLAGTVGFVASISESFCSNCDRLRLTADGQMRNCLFAREETDVRAILRRLDGSARAEALTDAIRFAVAGKRRGFGIDDPRGVMAPEFNQPERGMNAIGG